MTFDLSATSLALAKADTANIDGVNLMPFLAGTAEGAPHDTLFWRCRTRNNNYPVRRGNWKFVHSTEGTEQPGLSPLTIFAGSGVSLDEGRREVRGG